MTASDEFTPAAGGALRELARVAATLELPRLRDDALALASRVEAGRFYVACIGQFKRGKSTLIGALLDAPILPAGIVPVTAVPTVVRFGPTRRARVRLGGESSSAEAEPCWREIAIEDLISYVSEELNPENEKGVLGAEVFVPNQLLAGGMCLVDTPGLGSVFAENTAATEAFVPHIDAAIVLIGADPPISGDELDLIDEIGRHVRHMLFVLNKADRESDEERRVAGDFAQTVIARRLRRPVDRAFTVSATERLAHLGPPRDWESFERALSDLVTTSGVELAQNAGRRGMVRLERELRSVIAGAREALRRPLYESERHVRALEAALQDAEHACVDLAARLGAEQQRIAQRFGQERAAFVDRALAATRPTLDGARARMSVRYGPAHRRALMHGAQAVARAELEPWLRTQQERAAEAYRASMDRFVEMADEMLDRVAALGMPELVVLRGACGAGVRLGTRSAFVFNDVIHVAEPASPLRYLADVVFGVVAPRAIDRDAARFLAWLLEMNSTRVESDLNQRVAESRRGLEGDIRRLLNEVASRATRALGRARDLRAAGVPAVDQELRRLADLEDALDRLLISPADALPSRRSASFHCDVPAEAPPDT